ncbi:hypothetical protein OSB04_008884 [Centaurea solstitialis]|uniref:RRM domain-containing protein n=1 Tax=Centaurea solstitialis TaxID=347529 RepID=A0AA38TPC7_9ASTR|nr:hypothetical protein OSB04_008884 [Centaurea solstitialis]
MFGAKFPRKSAAYHFSWFYRYRSSNGHRRLLSSTISINPFFLTHISPLLCVRCDGISHLSSVRIQAYYAFITIVTTEVSMAGNESKTEKDVPPPSTPNSKAIVPETKTVKVSNVSVSVTEKDIWEFFSFSGEIHYIEMKSESETTKHAFVTFKDSEGAETAALLSGATIADYSVSVTPVENYKLPPEAPPLTAKDKTQASVTDKDERTREVVQKAEDVVSTMLAKGFVLGKDALRKAKSFDERHQLTTSASITYQNLDQKMGLTKNLSAGRAVVGEKMKEVDERYQVTEATKSALAAAEQKAASAGSRRRGSKTKEKLEKAEEEKEILNKENTNKANDDKSLMKDSPANLPATSADNPAAKSLDNPAAKSPDNPAKPSDNPAKPSDNPAKPSDNPAISSDKPAISSDKSCQSTDNPAKAPDNPAKARIILPHQRINLPYHRIILPNHR